MSTTSNSWKVRKIFCPNCRNLMIGCEDKDGFVKVTCNKCATVMVSKKMGRKHIRIDVYASQERICL